MEADDIINTVEEAVAVESVPTGLQAAPPPKEDHQAMIHQLPMNAPQIDFITMAEKVCTYSVFDNIFSLASGTKPIIVRLRTSKWMSFFPCPMTCLSVFRLEVKT